MALRMGTDAFLRLVKATWATELETLPPSFTPQQVAWLCTVSLAVSDMPDSGANVEWDPRGRRMTFHKKPILSLVDTESAAREIIRNLLINWLAPAVLRTQERAEA